MKSRPILLFDVMDTLVYNPFRHEIPAFFGMTSQELLQQKDATAWPDFETGSIDEEEYFRRYFQDRRPFDHEEFLRVVGNAYRWLEGMESLLDRLKTLGYEIHAFSNYPAWYQTIESRLQLSRYLDWTFVSCLTGVRKPSTQACSLPMQVLHRPADEFLLVDDRWENCAAAQHSGMQAIEFVGYDDLVLALARYGIHDLEDL